MVRRERDPQFINTIINAAGVREFIAPGDAPLDFTEIADKPVAQTGVLALSNGVDALGVFAMTTPTVWQSHTLFAPTCRGRKAIETAREMVDWMFGHGADIVWGSTPRDNRKACLFNRLIGAREIGGDDTDAIFEIRKAA